jgi:hypothetical protein
MADDLRGSVINLVGISMEKAFFLVLFVLCIFYCSSLLHPDLSDFWFHSSSASGRFLPALEFLAQQLSGPPPPQVRTPAILLLMDFCPA